MREPDPDAVATLPLFMAFDLLYHDGRDRTARWLEDVVGGSEMVFPVRRLAPDGLLAWTQVVERGYEGYVAKDEASVYEAGPTRRWLKVKQKTGPSPRTAGGGGSASCHRHPELDADVEGPVIWFGCECGARMARRADDGAGLDASG
jgi:hypothetical protein